MVLNVVSFRHGLVEDHSSLHATVGITRLFLTIDHDGRGGEGNEIKPSSKGCESKLLP